MVNKVSKTYKLRLTGAGVSLERDVSESLASRIFSLVLGSSQTDLNTNQFDLEVGDQRPIIDGQTPKQFMAAKRPMTDVEKVTCLAYYLTHFRNTPHFKTEEITSLNTEAAQPTFSNTTVAANNAVQKSLLSLAGGAKKQITAWGDELVDALPEREKAKAVLDSIPGKKKRTSGGKKKMKAEEN